MPPETELPEGKPVGKPVGGTGGIQSNALAANPLVGTAQTGTGVTGQSNVGPGISGQSLGLIVTGGSAIGDQTLNKPANDGVLGEGNNGIHGVSAAANGVLGENSGNGFGVTGTSTSGTGVYGVNGKPGLSIASDPGLSTPKFGCGVRGESDNGYGVYGASKTASGVYGTCDPGAGHLAGEFVGNVSVTGDHSVTGNVTATDVMLAGKDCAEEFDVVNAVQLEPGTVVVFDGNGAISQSKEPYNKRVAGVISGAGEYRPGLVLGRVGSSGEGKAPVALIGRVYCKVDASYAPIAVGDMLTTSPTPGFAMKASDPSMAFGAVVGKALASVDAGRELIPILVTLQ
jgi:hypothetical protein